MRAYYYGKPSSFLPKLAARLIKRENRVGYYCYVPILIAVWVVLIPPCFIFIKLGDVAHTVAGFCGFHSREW